MIGLKVILFYARAVVLFSLIVLCQQRPCSAASPSPEMIVGEHMPDFTAVYNLHIDFPLANTPVSEVRQELADYFNDLNKKIAVNPSAYTINGKPASEGFQFPPNASLGPLDGIMDGLRGKGLPRDIIVTISQKSNHICVKFKLSGDPSPDEHIWLYDGTKTLFGSPGRNAEIYQGYNFDVVNYFMLPGRAVGDFPLAKNLASTADAAMHLKADVAMTNPNAAQDASPQYLPGWLSLDQKGQGGATVARSFGSNEMESQDCTYASYRTVSPGVVLPSSVVMKLARKPNGILALRVYSIYTFKLVSATADPMPELTGQMASALNKPTIVTDFAYKPPVSIEYRPGESLEYELEAEHERQQAVNTMEPPSHT